MKEVSYFASHAIIDPANTREALMMALDAASLNPDVPKFNIGILQT